jgi:hypothetical protein
MYSRVNAARKGWSWPNFWANPASFSLVGGCMGGRIQYGYLPHHHAPPSGPPVCGTPPRTHDSLIHPQVCVGLYGTACILRPLSSPSHLIPSYYLGVLYGGLYGRDMYNKGTFLRVRLIPSYYAEILYGGLYGRAGYNKGTFLTACLRVHLIPSYYVEVLYGELYGRGGYNKGYFPHSLPPRAGPLAHRFRHHHGAWFSPYFRP